MSKIKRPLNVNAVNIANKALIPETGGRRLTMKREDYQFRKIWARAYRYALSSEGNRGPLGTSNNSPFIDSGTSAKTRNTPTGPNIATISIVANQENVDELSPIAQYIALEMNNNSRSKDVSNMLQFNNYSLTKCITEFQELPLWRQFLGLGITPKQCVSEQMSYSTAALLLWGTNVRQDGPWDHKPIIANRFNPRNPAGQQHWHLFGTTLYFYDLWSNIHYGYVGVAAGFSEAVLLDGAGLEQIGSTLLRGSLPSHDPTVQGMRAWDDAQDRIGVILGIRLYKDYPSSIRPNELLNAVLSTNGLATKPFIP